MIHRIHFSFAGLDRVSEAILLGIGGECLSVCSYVQSGLTYFQLEFLRQTFRKGIWYQKADVPFFLFSKGQKVKGHGVKNMVFG